MISKLLQEMIVHPCNALFFGLEMMQESVSDVMKLNAAIGRGIHYLSRPTESRRAENHSRNDGNG